MADQTLIDMLKKFVEGELQEFTIIDVKHHFNEFKKKGKESEYGTFMAKTCPTCKYALIFHGRTCGNTILSSRDSRLQTKAINADEDLQQELQTIMMEHDAVEVGSAHDTPTPTTAQARGFGYTPKPPACPEWDEGIEWEDFRTLVQHWDAANTQDTAHVKYIAFRAVLPKKRGGQGALCTDRFWPRR